MIDRSVLRWGGLSAMIGAVLGAVFNVLHPRSSDALESAQAELEMVADSDLWLFVHYMIGWSLVFAFVGLVAIGWSFQRGRAAGWARLATASAIGGAAIAVVAITVDGMALDAAAQRIPDAVGGSGLSLVGAGDAAVLAGAENVADLAIALFTATIVTFFGLTPALFGITTLASDDHPRWLGALALASGVLGIIVGSVQFLSGPSQIVTNVLFTIASVGFIAWTFIMGLRLWQGRFEEPGEPAGVREPVGV